MFAVQPSAVVLTAGTVLPVDWVKMTAPAPIVVEYFTESAKQASSAVTRLRRADFIEAMYAFSFVLANFGIAIAARMPMITTTISSSISVRPLRFIVISQMWFAPYLFRPLTQSLVRLNPFRANLMPCRRAATTRPCARTGYRNRSFHLSPSARSGEVGTSARLKARCNAIGPNPSPVAEQPGAPQQRIGDRRVPAGAPGVGLVRVVDSAGAAHLPGGLEQAVRQGGSAEGKRRVGRADEKPRVAVVDREGGAVVLEGAGGVARGLEQCGGVLRSAVGARGVLENAERHRGIVVPDRNTQGGARRAGHDDEADEQPAQSSLQSREPRAGGQCEAGRRQIERALADQDPHRKQQIRDRKERQRDPCKTVHLHPAPAPPGKHQQGRPDRYTEHAQQEPRIARRRDERSLLQRIVHP